MIIDSFDLLPIYDENFNIYIDGATVIDNKITLKKGSYDLQLTFNISKENKGDTLALYINNSLFYCINIPINKEVNFTKILTFNIDKDDTILSFINESDDFITMESLMGGLFMSEQLQIVNIGKFNPFSIDLELSVPFTDDISVKVTELNSDPINTPKEINTKIVDKLNLKDPSKSTAENPNLKTVIISGDINDSNNLFKSNTPYSITVFNETDSFTDIYSFDFQNFTMMNENNCTVKSIGTRIIAIEFDYPVKNLDAIVKNTVQEPQYTELNNFYMLYTGLDTNMGENENVWLGNIDIERIYTTGPTETKVHPFTATVSEDKRRIEIQCNSTNFNTGSVNKISINFTKHQDNTKRLTDFSNRPIAVFEKAFSCSRNSIATTITDIKANSNHEIEVTFEDSVCIRTNGIEELPTDYFTISKEILPSTTVNLDIQRVSRVGNGFNKLSYLLNTDDISNLLNIPECTIKVGTVLDASGLDTLEVQRTIEVPLTNPVFEDAYQDGDNSGDKTRIIAVFNEPMERDSNINDNSATNPSNYVLQKGELGLPIPIESIVPIGDPAGYEFKITINSVLPTGEYFITALENIKDITGVNIATKQLKLDIIDYTSPEIDMIIATKPVDLPPTLDDKDNGFIIMFKQPMNVMPGSATSALRQGNYRLTYEESPGIINSYFLDATTITEQIFENRWIRYTLPTTTPPGIPDFDIDKYKIFIGYTNGPELNYVTSESGNIYPLCTPGKIDYLVNQLDIQNGTAIVTSDTKLEYHLNSSILGPTIENNLFYNVSATDFQVIINGGSEPVDVVTAVLSPNTFTDIIFTFPQGTFNSGDTIQLIVKQEDTATITKDIFGKPILRSSDVGNVGKINADNQIPTTIEGISLLAINHDDVLNNGVLYQTAVLELKFAKNIQSTETHDFAVYYKDSQNLKHSVPVLSSLIAPSIGDLRTNAIQLTVALLQSEINEGVINYMFVNTVNNPPFKPFNTFDVENHKVAQFQDEQVEILTVNEFEWKYVPQVSMTQDGYELILKFNKPISTEYANVPEIPPSYSINVVRDDINNKKLTITIPENINGYVKLGQIQLMFTENVPEINTWEIKGITMSENNFVMTIIVGEVAADTNLFSGAIDAKAARGRAIYAPYTVVASVPNTDNAVIVNVDDNLQLYRVNKNSDAIS